MVTGRDTTVIVVSEREIANITEQTRAWASSPEGQEEIRSSLAIAVQTVQALENAQRIDPSKLREPVSL